MLFILLFYCFLFKDYIEQYIPVVGLTDELFSLLAIPIFLLALKRNQFILTVHRTGYGKYILLFLVIGLISSSLFQYQSFLKVALPDAFICIKFWLALYIGTQFFSKIPLERFAHKIYFHIKLVSLLYLLLFCADQVLGLFPSSIRYGLRSTQLMYSHPTVFVACCVFLIVILLSIREFISGYRKWLILLLFLMCTTLRSKAFGTALATLFICYFVFYRKKQIRVRTLLMFVPLIIVLAWEQIEFYFFSSIQSDSARYQLLVKSLEIAKDHFPLGSGFGTFASHYSGVNYSPLYAMYGLTNVNGLREGATYFVSDSFWPMVIGQAGFLGLIAFTIALFMLFKSIQKIRNIRPSYYASALCGICYLFITSMAESAFVHPVAVPIAMWIGIMLGQQ
ncbi:MAG: O-antigen ligase family protein [Faecousia sp.]